MDNYMNLLIRQYAKAKGIAKIDYNDKELLKEVEGWLIEMSKIGKNYLQFLDSLGVNYNKVTCAEVGKSEYDTIVKNKKAVIITPETRYIEGVKKERIITANVCVDEENKVNLVTVRGQIRIPNYIFSTFMTQNVAPFRIEKWKDLHNFSDSSIIVGAYGSINDKDIIPKLTEIQKFRQDLDDSIVYDYEMIGDSYVVAIASKKTVLEKVKK